MESIGGNKSVKNKNFNKKIKTSFLFFIFLAFFIFSVSPFVCADQLNTTVSIYPQVQSVLPEENFIFNIYCNPAEPIKGFELQMLFDASLIEVNSVT